MKNNKSAPGIHQSIDTGLLMILAASMFAGLRPLFARLLINDGLTAIVNSFYCYLGSLIFFLPVGLHELKRDIEKKKTAFVCVGLGILVGIGGIAYFEALARLPVALVTLIYFSYPAFVVFLKAVHQGRWPPFRTLSGILFVFLGIYLIVSKGLALDRFVPADFLIAFIAPLSFSVLIICLGGPLNRIGAYSRAGFICTGAVLTISLAALLYRPVILTPTSFSGWIGLTCMVSISGVVCQALYTYGVQIAGAERSSFAGALEIVVSMAIGWVVFSEAIYADQIWGAVFIILSLFVTRKI